MLCDSIRRMEEFPHPAVFPCDNTRRPAGRIAKRLGRYAYGLGLSRYPPVDPDRARVWTAAARAHKAALIHAHFGPGGVTMLPLRAAFGRAAHSVIPWIRCFNDAS